MADLLEHAPDLAVLALDQRDLVPGIFTLADQANFRWCRFLALRPPPLRLVIPSGGDESACGFIAGVEEPALDTCSVLLLSLKSGLRRNRQTSPKFFQSRLGRRPGHLYHIGLRHMRCRFH